jgi:chemotaxis-related protein WspB
VLLLAFSIGRHRYALEARQVIEVLPLVDIRPIPQAPPGVAGIFDFRGLPVPILDLSVLLAARPSRQSLSTRLVIVGYPDATGERRPLALIAERATRTFERERSHFVDSGITHEGSSYLGPIASDDEGLLQWIDVGRLLPAAVRDALFQPHETSQWPSPISKPC